MHSSGEKVLESLRAMGASLSLAGGRLGVGPTGRGRFARLIGRKARFDSSRQVGASCCSSSYIAGRVSAVVLSRPRRRGSFCLDRSLRRGLV